MNKLNFTLREISCRDFNSKLLPLIESVNDIQQQQLEIGYENKQN